MNIKLNTPFDIQELIQKLKENDFIYFSDERSRVIDINLFIPIFMYKYGNITDFSITVQRAKTLSGESKDSYILHCNCFGFVYCFPLIKEL
jgi:hypothetical protein